MRDARWLAPVLVFFLLVLSGCAGGRGARPAGPDAPSAIPGLLAAADSARARGDHTSARKAYGRAADAARRAGLRDPELRAELGSGLSSLALGEADPARKSLTRAAQIDPRSAAVHLALGRLNAAIRRYADAKVEFERSAALDTTSAEPLYQLGLAAQAAGDTKLAAESFQRALARDPTHVPSQNALGTALDARFVAAGLPQGYGGVQTHPSVSRGELGVLLAAELGLRPDRPGWSGKDLPSDTQEARGAWGEPWLRLTLARGWIRPFPDGSFHFGDPVTRGTLALLIAEIRGPVGARSAADVDAFPDLGRRHYLARVARAAIEIGLPVRAEGRFEPWASATGSETIQALRGLARALGVAPITGEEPGKR